MGPIVLIAGAWLGGWCWKRVVPFLRAARQEVYTPTLTGLGERRHLAHPDVDLGTHVQDVVSVLEFEDLDRVVLTGHSYSGMVITGVAERAAERLAHLVYVDASVPQDGESMCGKGPSQFQAFVEAQARSRGDGWRWPLPDLEELSSFASLAGLTDADRRWFQSKTAAQPLKTLTQALHVANPRARAIPRTYIRCTAEREGRPLPESIERLRQAGGWQYRELATGHWPMISTPRELADLLLEVARR
jgi:pimeloyl-ACP methyl ester carboxylesterase